MRDLIADGPYTFADYFKMTAEVEDILAHFGFAFEGRLCDLPSHEVAPASLADLRTRIEESLPFLSLSNETARREFLIAPVLLETVRHTHAKLRAELPIEVNEQLKGTHSGRPADRLTREVVSRSLPGRRFPGAGRAGSRSPPGDGSRPPPSRPADSLASSHARGD